MMDAGGHSEEGTGERGREGDLHRSRRQPSTLVIPYCVVCWKDVAICRKMEVFEALNRSRVGAVSELSWRRISHSDLHAQPPEPETVK